jgi:hypothetical protein
LCLFWPALGLCQAPRPSILCRNGDGILDTAFRNKVSVHVGAAREPGRVALAKRTCAAKLTWEKQEIVVEAGASQPTGILLEFQSVAGKQTSLPPQLRLDLIIDAAGKVRSTQPPLGVSPSEVAVTSTWKFIPAFKDGRPVACHLRISVWPKQ